MDFDRHECGSHNAPEPGTLPIAAKRRSFLKGVGTVAGISALGGRGVAQQGGGDEQRRAARARNAILVIHDGMGRSQVSGARYLKAYRNDPDRFPLNAGPGETQLHMDRHEAQGTMTTFPATANEVVPDSASTATSMSGLDPDCAAFATGAGCGIKTYPGAIGGVQEGGEFVPVETIVEAANDAGLATGLVTTTRITHATPAAFGAHVETRFREDEIARQYIEESDIDLLLGGGREHFDPDQRDDGRDLVSDAEAAGYEFVETADELEDVDQAPVLGLFSGSHLDMYLDREFGDTTQPGLVQMAEKAIELLSQVSQNEGFFLMLEAGRIDHAGHYNDPSILDEQLEGDRATGVCLDFAQSSGTQPTMVVTTADHECGGFSLGRDGIHNVNYELIDQLEASVAERLKPIIDETFPSVENYRAVLEEEGGIPWEEFDRNLNDRDKFWQFYLGPNFTEQGKIRQRLNRRMLIAFTSFGHTGVDVPLYAEGPNSEFFNTVRDNTDIPQVIADALRISDGS